MFKTQKAWAKAFGKQIEAKNELVKENETLKEMLDALMGDSVYVLRPEFHHVILREDYFAMEHPLTCSLSDCALYERAMDAWYDAPGEPGRYLIDDDLNLLPEQESVIYACYKTPAGWPGAIFEA